MHSLKRGLNCELNDKRGLCPKILLAAAIQIMTVSKAFDGWTNNIHLCSPM